MQTNEILQFVQDNDEFLITYYAKKYGKIITRRGTWTKPNTDIKGKYIVINDDHCFFFILHSFYSICKIFRIVDSQAS